jgi:hypothetical protein
MVNKVAEKKRDREKRFQVWLDPLDDKHAFVITMLEAYRDQKYKDVEILIKMAYALNQTGDIPISMPENSTWLESAIKNLMSGMNTLQDMLKSGRFTLEASQEDQQKIQQVHNDMSEMETSIAARYHSYAYDPSSDDREDDF